VEELGMSAGKQVVFDLDGTLYSVDIERVERILTAPKLTPLPSQPEDVLGIFDLAGRMTPVVSLRHRFGLRSLEDGYVIVVRTNVGPCGWQVDRLDGIEEPEALEDCPPFLAGRVHQAVQGVFRAGKRLVTVLEPDDCSVELAEEELVAAA
jgi:chemotaxis signal transduction protein